MWNGFLKAIGYLPMKPLDDEDGGFEKDPIPLPCNHPSHNPPGHLYIPPGKMFRHVCPGCGFSFIVRPPITTCKCDHKKPGEH